MTENIEFNRGAINAGECLSDGWNLVKQNYWVFFGILLVGTLIISCLPIINLFLIGPIACGFYYVMLRQYRGEQVEFGMMFKGFEHFVPAFVVGLISMIPGVLSYVLQLIEVVMKISAISVAGDSDAAPGVFAAVSVVFLLVRLLLAAIGILLGFFLFFAYPLVVDKEIGAIDAIKLSAKAVMGNVGGLILLFLLLFALMLAGFLACFIGLFFVLPIAVAMNTCAYRQVFPDSKSPVQNTPPPPSEYGDMYGQNA